MPPHDDVLSCDLAHQGPRVRTKTVTDPAIAVTILVIAALRP
jgi:hypothetical protein